MAETQRGNDIDLNLPAGRRVENAENARNQQLATAQETILNFVQRITGYEVSQLPDDHHVKRIYNEIMKKVERATPEVCQKVIDVAEEYIKIVERQSNRQGLLKNAVNAIKDYGAATIEAIKDYPTNLQKWLNRPKEIANLPLPEELRGLGRFSEEATSLKVKVRRWKFSAGVATIATLACIVQPAFILPTLAALGYWGYRSVQNNWKEADRLRSEAFSILNLQPNNLFRTLVEGITTMRQAMDLLPQFSDDGKLENFVDQRNQTTIDEVTARKMIKALIKICYGRELKSNPTERAQLAKRNFDTEIQNLINEIRQLGSARTPQERRELENKRTELRNLYSQKGRLYNNLEYYLMDVAGFRKENQRVSIIEIYQKILENEEKMKREEQIVQELTTTLSRRDIGIW